ncbi:unnamed protein product [Menidia menidia]|uniref:(Atlantic silverside) hypothetical protein n=1 Tax=Menidia menidia TaxID=238744 RepID=A0A8S4AUI6_9TELE|nr:unnamed protein product [Menidia menidia]
MYARTNASSTHGDFQDRNGVNYVSSSESFGHCSQLFWKKDPNDSGVRKPPIASELSQQTKAASGQWGTMLLTKHQLKPVYYAQRPAVAFAARPCYTATDPFGELNPSSTISWCDQLPSSSAALSSSSLSSASLSTSSLSMESQAPAPAPPPPPPSATTATADDMDSDERPYVCDLCSCAYKHASSLLNHKLTHKTGDFRCDFCSKPYTNYMSLRNHMRIHGQKRYMCDLCGKAFRLARYLRNHQRIHDDGPNRFDCPSCCKSYRTMLELAQHRCSAAASNQNRFNCPSCFKSYRTMLDLAQHRCSAAAKNQVGVSVRVCVCVCVCVLPQLKAFMSEQHQQLEEEPFGSQSPHTHLSQLQLCFCLMPGSGGRRGNFSAAPRRQQQQQNSGGSLMQPPHGGHGQQEPLPSHCVSPMSQGGQGGVASQPGPDPHQQGRPSSVPSQSSQQSMRSSTSNKHVPSSSANPSSYSLLQPLVPDVKEISSGYTRLSANPMVGQSASCAAQGPLDPGPAGPTPDLTYSPPATDCCPFVSSHLCLSLLPLQPKHQDTFSLAPQRPLTTINPIGHSLHPNGAPSIKPSPVPRSIQAMPWEQRSLYNQ